MNYLVLIFLLCFCVIKSHGYYWRDFSKGIPSDAFSAGEEIKKGHVYIGQIFLCEEPFLGIYPTGIVAEKGIYSPRIGSREANNFIQILCSENSDNFEWIPTNSTHLHLLKADNEFVHGGIEDGELIAIGRLRYQGEIVIGKITSGNIGRAIMCFVYNGNEEWSETYEVLTYNNILTKIGVRINVIR